MASRWKSKSGLNRIFTNVSLQTLNVFDAPLPKNLHGVGLQPVREVFERIAPYKRASIANQRRSPFLAAQHRKLVTGLRARLFAWLPELDRAPAPLVEAIDQATSFEAWDRLRGE